MSRKIEKGINPELESAITDLLKQVMADPTATINDKMRVADRALKIEALKLKMSDDEWGSGFLGLEEEEEK